MIQVSYPGVYVQEIPSGVRTITGVSTSVTAFVGVAKSGPIDEAVSIRSWADFERRFGGLANASELSFGVYQFFQNGGTEAVVVRLAKDPVAAWCRCTGGAAGSGIELEALAVGKAGNAIEVRIDHATSSPGSTFNLTLVDHEGDAMETYLNASMNGADPRFIESLVNGRSRLVQVKRLASAAHLGALGQGTSSSGVLGDVSTLLDDRHGVFQVSANGSPFARVQLKNGDWEGGTPAARLDALAVSIGREIQKAAGGDGDLLGLAVSAADGRLVFTSGDAGEASRVRFLPGEQSDASAVLKLGPDNGGLEQDAAAVLRPDPAPEHGQVASGAFAGADLDAIPSAAMRAFDLKLDDYPTRTVELSAAPAAGATLQEKVADVAGRIETAVRALNTSAPAYKDFTCTPGPTGDTLVLASGTRGAGSVVAVGPGIQDLAASLKLLPPAKDTPGADVHLQGGDEQPVAPADAYAVYIGDRSKREGLYALEAVDLFNLLCLPGVEDAAILADATSYCVERRAMLIVDGPRAATHPDQVVTLARGPSLPKNANAAVYWPWVRIANPLEGSKLRDTAPSGAVAGLFARTDAARGVWKAPAGIEATLSGVQATGYALTDRENGALNQLGVNCIRVFPVFGPVAWGARTLRGADQQGDEYKYVPIKRLALYLEESLYRGTQWAVFEPNDEPLWAQLRLNLGAFMHGLFVQGAFAGKSPRDAYLVKCDRETTTQDDVNKGIVNVLVGFAPLRPAEFVVIRIQQLAGQIQA